MNCKATLNCKAQDHLGPKPWHGFAATNRKFTKRPLVCRVRKCRSSQEVVDFSGLYSPTIPEMAGLRTANSPLHGGFAPTRMARFYNGNWKRQLAPELRQDMSRASEAPRSHPSLTRSESLVPFQLTQVTQSPHSAHSSSTQLRANGSEPQGSQGESDRNSPQVFRKCIEVFCGDPCL